jgi:hypothetical protein
MNGQTAIARSDDHRSALRKILDAMEPELAMGHGSKKERSFMKYAIILSEAELDCIVKLCQQTIASKKPKKAALSGRQTPKVKTGDGDGKRHVVSDQLF